jgi:protein-S-isoprenylcysteine O-methyltransferase Ste14
MEVFMFLLQDPLFWALLSMLGLTGACLVVGTSRVGKHPLMGGVIVTVFFMGRFIMVLPYLPQPRFDLGPWQTVIGGVLFVCGLFLSLAPCFSIRPLNDTNKDTQLATNGFYGFVRNPIFLGELLWCFGWSMVHGSIIGIVLILFWWAGLLVVVLLEEERLEKALGREYLEYKAKVKGRIIPGLPF